MAVEKTHLARFALVIFDDGCVERFDFVDGPQTGHRSAAVRPGHGRILVLLLGDVLGHRLVDGERRTLDVVRMLFQRPAVTPIERVVAGYFQNALAGQFVAQFHRIVVTRFADAAVARRQRQLRLLGANLFHDVFDDGLGHCPAEPFDDVIAKQRLAGLGEILQLVVVAAVAPLALLAAETLVVFRILAGNDNVRNETLFQLFGHLLLPEAQLRQLHDGRHAVGTSPLVFDVGMVALLARFLEKPGTASSSRRRRIHRRRRLRFGIFARVARSVRLADGFAASPD